MDVRVASANRAESRFSYSAFLRWEVGYILVLLLTSLSGNQESLKQIANGVALLFVLRIAAFLLVRVHRLEARSRAILLFATVLTFANVLTNIDQEQFSESIKIFSLFLFYFAGEATDDDIFDQPPSLLLVGLFVGLPVLSALASLYFGYSASRFAAAPLAFFANRNNAVAFAVVSAWTLILLDVRRWVIVCYLVVCVLAFKTLGALVALSVAVYLAYFGFNLLGTVAVLTLAGALFYWLGDDLDILSRATTSWTTLGKVLEQAGGVWNLGKLDYAQIYEAAGTHDISLVFRIKHWVNLITLYMDGSLIHQLFGFGVLTSTQLTDEKLLPHNDYLRFAFELGPGLLLCFVAMNVLILRETFARFISIPAIFLCIYFFSDNLVNNLVVMSFFYFTAGALVGRRRRLKANGWRTAP